MRSEQGDGAINLLGAPSFQVLHLISMCLINACMSAAALELGLSVGGLLYKYTGVAYAAFFASQRINAETTLTTGPGQEHVITCACVHRSPSRILLRAARHQVLARKLLSREDATTMMVDIKQHSYEEPRGLHNVNSNL